MFEFPGYQYPKFVKSNDTTVIPVPWPEGGAGCPDTLTTWQVWKAAVVGPKGVSISTRKVMTSSYLSSKHHGSQSPPRAPTAWELKAYHSQLLYTLHPLVKAELDQREAGERVTQLWCPAGLTRLSGRSKEIKNKRQVWPAVVLGVPTAAWQKRQWGLPGTICPLAVTTMRPLKTEGNFSQRRCFR